MVSTAVKHPVLDRVKPSFVVFDTQALWGSRLIVRVSGYEKLEMTVNQVCHRMLYSCTHMETVDVKGLVLQLFISQWLLLCLHRVVFDVSMLADDVDTDQAMIKMLLSSGAGWTAQCRGRVSRTSGTNITPRTLMIGCSSCTTRRHDSASTRASRNRTTRQFDSWTLSQL